MDSEMERERSEYKSRKQRPEARWHDVTLRDLLRAVFGRANLGRGRNRRHDNRELQRS